MEEKNQPRRPRRSPEEPLQKNESLVYGKNPVTELLKSGSGVDTVLIAEGMAPAVAAYYTALAKDAGATVKVVEYLRKANSAMATTIRIRKLTRRGSAMVTGPSGI